MSTVLTVPAEGITEVVVDGVASDAKIRSFAELTEIQVQVGRDGPPAGELVVEGDKVRLTKGFAVRIDVPQGVAVTAEEASGDLKVAHFAGVLRIGSVHGDLRAEDVSGRIEIEQILADVRAEEVAEMQVGSCEGDFRFSGGDLHMQTLHGDMRATDAGSVQVVTVHGDLWLERLAGSVSVEAAHGDARLVEIQGAAGVGMVAGDFRAANVAGALKVGQVHGDAQLEGPFPAAEGYAVSAFGDAAIRLTAQDDVRLTVKALGRIRSNLQLTPSADGSTTYTATVGEGKASVALTANGDLRVEAAAGGREDVRGPWDRRRGRGDDPFADLSGLGERIRQQVTASLAAAGINTETGEIDMNLGFGRVRAGRGRAPETPRPPRPPEPPKPAQTPQMSGEQLTVLKMLEEGRISPEEADSLLKALGA